MSYIFFSCTKRGKNISILSNTGPVQLVSVPDMVSQNTTVSISTTSAGLSTATYKKLDKSQAFKGLLVKLHNKTCQNATSQTG